MTKYTYNVGEVIFRENECFWIFPSGYIKNQECIICSPWFSCMGEKWRLVKDPYSEITANKDTIFCYKYSDLIFRLWRRVRSSLLKYKYTIQLSLKTSDGDDLIKCVGNIDSDYGCQLKFPDIMNTIFSENGLVKIFFNIRKEEYIATTPEMRSEHAEGEAEAHSNNEDIKNEGSSEDEMSSEDGDVGNKKNNLSKNKGVEILTEDLKRALLNGQMCDAVLNVDGREFNVHKMMLVSRSPVFKTMFEHDLEEKKNNIVDIPDCTAESFEVFLHYLYTGNANTISIDNVCSLYYIADKYHIDDLKKKCVKFMKRNLFTENFCDVIALSLHHNEPMLMKLAIRFFCENIKIIIKTVQWQNYMAQNPTEANELLIKALDA